jgi:hypothetical protein
MRIIRDQAAKLERGDFSARIRLGELALPEELVSLLGRSNVATAEAFVTQLHTFPGAIARTLRWSEDEVNLASRALFEILKDHVEAPLLQSEAPRRRVFGARRSRTSG